MSSYNPVYLYQADGLFVGYAIMGPLKLQSTNVYKEGEEDQLNEQLTRLNQDVDLRQHWPHPRDPDVVRLLEDESFEPIEYMETEIVDEEHSQFVYQKIAGQDKSGNPCWIDSEDIDPETSVIVYKTARVPRRPTDTMMRIKKACEQIARQRAHVVVSLDDA